MDEDLWNFQEDFYNEFWCSKLHHYVNEEFCNSCNNC